MGVVDVDGDLVGEVPVGVILLVVLVENALQRCRHQKILLTQAQTLSLDVIVGRIQHLGDRLGHRVALERADIVAAREGRHVEAVGHACAPQNELVDGVTVVAGDEHVVRHGRDRLIVGLRGAEFAVLIHPFVDVSAEAHLDRLILARVQPHIAHFQPVVGELHLPAVNDLLLEDTELIPDREARHRVAETGGRVHIARCQPSEAAVSEACVGVHAAEVFQREALLLQDLIRQLEKPQIIQVVAERRAHKELHRHVIDLLALLVADLAAEGAAFLLQKQSRVKTYNAVHLLFRCLLQRAAKGIEADLLQPFK